MGRTNGEVEGGGGLRMNGGGGVWNRAMQRVMEGRGRKGRKLDIFSYLSSINHDH